MAEAVESGYLPSGVTRTLNEDGSWSFNENQEVNGKGADRPYDEDGIFSNTRLFPDSEMVVQIVTFSRARTPGLRPVWHRQLKTPEEVRKALRQEIPENSWRWVHCEGLHGPTLRAVAEGTEWHPRKFGGIFTWTRPSMEFANNRLLLHLRNQGSRIYTWQGAGKRPLDTFITCVKMNKNGPSDCLPRLFDFVDHGCSRPEVRLHEDPSLLYYGIVRAVIQDLRFVAHEVHEKMEKVYRHVVSHPSPLNLSEFHRDQNLLIGLSLDTTALSLAAANLCAAADSMHPGSDAGSEQADRPEPLISQESRDRLLDQMGLIHLLYKELPYISSRADALVQWAFDMLAFQNNNLLQLLAVATLASIPISVATGILGINYFDSSRINGKQIGVVLGIVGGIVTIILVWFVLVFWSQHKDWEKGSKRASKVHQQTQAELRDWAVSEDRERNMELARENTDVAQLAQNPPGSLGFITNFLYRSSMSPTSPIRITP